MGACSSARARAVAEGHQGHVAAGMPKHAGRTRLGGQQRAKTLCGRFKTVAWPRAGLLCKEGQAEHGVGISAWSASVSVRPFVPSKALSPMAAMAKLAITLALFFTSPADAEFIMTPINQLVRAIMDGQRETYEKMMGTLGHHLQG